MIKKIINSDKKTLTAIREPLFIILFITPFLFGGFYEFISCIISVVLLVLILLKREIKFSLDLGAIAAGCIPLFYLLSIFWAVDKGMVAMGFMKFLPIPLFVLLILHAPEKREQCLTAIPCAGVLMTVISFLLSFFSGTEGHLTVSGRLAGFFEYPNTFALFLLLGLIILTTSEKPRVYYLFLGAILLFGIFQSGSRTVFGLLLLSTIIIVIFGTNKCVRKITLIVIPVSIAAAVLITLATGNFQTVGRFLTSSLSQSSFLGRLLYYQDALPIIVKNPFGLGYDGYFYTQGSFQTGIYTVKYIHNDFLQLLLDIGWVPFLLLSAAIVKAFFKKGATLQKRTLLIAICGHCMLDFSLQYISIFFILLLLLDYEKIYLISKLTAKKLVFTFGALLSAISLYFAAASFSFHIGKYDIAVRIYPFYTDGYITLMTKETDIETAKLYSNKVMQLNKSVYQAYLIESLYDFGSGNMKSAIENREKAILLSPYTLSSYTEYMEMLERAIILYKDAGDDESAEFCRKKLVSLPKRFDEAIDKTSTLGWLINDLPPEMPEEYKALAEKYKTK